MSGCSGVEVAACIGLSKEALYRRCESEQGVTFSEYRQSKIAKGDGWLRKKQFGTAMMGDRQMQIWLGKNRLGQRDTPREIEFSGETVAQFDSLMKQISGKQEERQIKEADPIEPANEE